MSNVIQFRTREELEKEKQNKIKKDWDDFLELERRFGNYIDENDVEADEYNDESEIYTNDDKKEE